MWISILNYQEGEVQLIEIDDNTSEEKTTEEAINDRLGHSDFHYMTSDKLKLIVDNECE